MLGRAAHAHRPSSGCACPRASADARSGRAAAAASSINEKSKTALDARMPRRIGLEEDMRRSSGTLCNLRGRRRVSIQPIGDQQEPAAVRDWCACSPAAGSCARSCGEAAIRCRFRRPISMWRAWAETARTFCVRRVRQSDKPGDPYSIEQDDQQEAGSYPER